MVIQPKIRGFICTTAHPTGCFRNVEEQIAYVKKRGPVLGAKRVLVLGCSTGYGLSSRIVSAFGCGASTIGVAFERPASGARTATAGWYQTAAFEQAAKREGLYAQTINGDAFSREIKEQVIEKIRKDLGKIDLVVYSIAAPRRTTADGTTYHSVIKPVGEPYTNKTIDLKTGEIAQITLEPASPEEIEATVKVMGGEDWKEWMLALRDADVLEKNAVTISYSYIGPEITHPLYRGGTIGKAKEHLEKTAKEITADLSSLNGHAYVSVNKALVTQASSAIPVVPLYIAMLFQKMKEQGTHEDCIQQIDRLYREKLFVDSPILDEEGRLRMDDWEMEEEIQSFIRKQWQSADGEQLKAAADLKGYWSDFYKLFGFGIDGIEYEADVSPEVEIPSLSEK